MKASILICALITVTLTGFAQESSSLREQLKQYLADLQKNPADDALREKVIKLALTITPKPAPPPEADEQSGRAKYLLKNATSESDFAAAAKAFSSASDLVPWEPEYYFNQGVALEKSKQFEKAIIAFKWYLLAAPDADDAKAVRERIGGLKVASEKSSEAVAAATTAADRERQKNGGMQELRRLVEGKLFKTSFCQVGNTFGCTWAQYSSGNNWKTYGSLVHWEFRGDDAYLVQDNNIDVFRIRSHGASLSDLIWEYTSPLGGFYTWQLVSSRSDLSEFVVGSMRSKDEPSLHPNKDFVFFWYQVR